MLGRRNKKPPAGEEPVLGSNSREMKNTQDDVGEILAEINRLKQGNASGSDESYQKRPGEVVPQLKSAEVGDEKISAKMLFKTEKNQDEPQSNAVQEQEADTFTEEPEKPSFESMERPSVESMYDEIDEDEEEIVRNLEEKPESNEVQEAQKEQSNDTAEHSSQRLKRVTQQNPGNVTPIAVDEKQTDQKFTMNIQGTMCISLQFDSSGQSIEIKTDGECLKVTTCDGAELNFPLKKPLTKAA